MLLVAVFFALATIKNCQSADPLIITKLLNDPTVNIEDIQKKAEVIHSKFSFKSYAGYFTVDSTYNSNLFVWYVPATVDPINAPVIVWLNGGPGVASSYGLFFENGPVQLDITDDSLKERMYKWSKIGHVLYIDNPVGSGFSFTENPAGFSKTSEEAGDNLYEAVSQFFQLFPKLQTNDFYISGESYGCKFVAALGHIIHHRNKDPKNMEIHLKGATIGNGWCVPKTQLVYGDYLYQLGLVDWQQRCILNGRKMEVQKLIRNYKFVEAFMLFQDLIKYILGVTGFQFYFNVITPYFDNTDYDLQRFLTQSDIREALHVGNTKFTMTGEIVPTMAGDYMNSAAEHLKTLLRHYRTYFYNGQFDIAVPYPNTVNFIRHLQFPGRVNYLMNAKRQIWHVNGEVAGYAKKSYFLTEILVRNAGHKAVQDKQEWVFDLMLRVVSNKDFD